MVCLKYLPQHSGASSLGYEYEAFGFFDQKSQNMTFGQSMESYENKYFGVEVTQKE